MLLYAKTTDTTSDPVKYEQWQAKIKAYRDSLSKGILKEYRLETVPLQTELDKGIDATKYVGANATAREKEITALGGVVLAREIAKGTYTSVEVFKAFAKNAVICHQLTNAAMELFIDVGLKRAEELDAYLAEHGKPVGALHGLPVSLKEHYDYAGRITHASYVGYLDNIPEKHALTLQNLYDQGAVFYIRSTEPQTLMHVCSLNNITGKCRNPNNTSLTPGGSLSGEGALAAMKGSVFGLGSDIGGSIRIPAAFCGVWGLRPSLKRISCLGVASAYEDQVQEIVYPVLGPLAGSADDIDLFMSAVLGQEPWNSDPLIVPIPWRQVPEPKPTELTVAIIYDDGVVRPAPPISRALNLAKEKLEKAGITVVEWHNIDVEEIIQAAYSGYNTDGNTAQKKALALSGEPILDLTEKYLTFGPGDNGHSGVEVQKLAHVRDAGRISYMNQLNARNIDFILSPTFFSVAPRPELASYWGYTNLWNILDFPNVVFPTGLKVDEKSDTVLKLEPRNPIEEYEYGLYGTAEEHKNAPICLQLTGRRYADETVVKAAKVLHKVIAGDD